MAGALLHARLTAEIGRQAMIFSMHCIAPFSESFDNNISKGFSDAGPLVMGRRDLGCEGGREGKKRSDIEMPKPCSLKCNYDYL